MVAIFGTMMTIFKALPAAEKLFRGLVDLYTDMQLSKVEKTKITADEERAALGRAIRNANTDTELIALSKVMHMYNLNNELSEYARSGKVLR